MKSATLFFQPLLGRETAKMLPIGIFLTIIGMGFLASKDKLGVFLHGLGYLTAAVAILILLFFGCAYLYMDFVHDLWVSGVEL